MMGLVVEHFCPLYVASPPYRPLCFFGPLPFKIAPKGAILPTLRNTGVEPTGLSEIAVDRELFKSDWGC